MLPSLSGRVGTLHRILKLNNRLMQPFSTHLSHRHNISLNEFRLLMAIGRLGESASHELAEHTGVNAMSVSRAVGTLQRHGRITVATDPEPPPQGAAPDRGRRAAVSTSCGRRASKWPISCSPMSDGEEIAKLTRRMIARLEATDAEGDSDDRRALAGSSK